MALAPLSMHHMVALNSIFVKLTGGIDIDKHLFYNKTIATEGDWEGKMEEYRKKICDLINKVNNEATLRYIYVVINSYLKSRGI